MDKSASLEQPELRVPRLRSLPRVLIGFGFLLVAIATAVLEAGVDRPAYGTGVYALLGLILIGWGSTAAD